MSKKYFYNGKLVEYCGIVPNNARKAIVRVVKNYVNEHEVSQCEELYVDQEALEEPIDELFAIGDRVSSNLGGWNSGTALKGTITGFELQNNRAVVQSAKVDNYNNTRTRYAYKVTELKEDRSHKYYEFEKGKFYRINDNVNVMAVKQPSDEEELLMLITKHGNVVHTDLAPIADKVGLALNEGIKSVEPAKGWR